MTRKHLQKEGVSFVRQYDRSGRTFDKEVFLEKSKKLIFCIVSNVNFPEIKIKFVKGEELATKYPTGVIPLNDHNKFFD